MVLSGTRIEGYARLAGPGSLGCQLRWQSAKAGADLNKALSHYLERLKTDAKRAKVPFSCESKPIGQGLAYRWTAEGQARGSLVFEPDSSRVLFLEVFGAKKDQLLPLHRQVSDSLRSSVDEEMELWLLFGLSLRVPAGLSVLSKKLESGRTTLELGAKRHWVHAQRWSFAEQLIQKHGLENWVSGLLGKRARVVEGPFGEGRVAARYAQGPLRSRLALIRHQPDRNQIVVLKTLDVKDSSKWPWDWIV